MALTSKANRRWTETGYGHIEIDNNLIENCIRPSALGKRSWLFVGHPDAGWKSAVICCILGTCKLLDGNPELYLNWALPKLAAATNLTAARRHVDPDTLWEIIVVDSTAATSLLRTTTRRLSKNAPRNLRLHRPRRPLPPTCSRCHAYN